MSQLRKEFKQVIETIEFPTDLNELLQTQRLFHGRGHAYKGLNHITIDWLPPVILITLFAPEPREDIEMLANALLEKLPSCKSVQLQHRYLSPGPVEIIHGKDCLQDYQQLEIIEGNLKYHLSLGKVRNTGLFLDMRNGRQWVQDNSKDKRILNLFAYTCGFSVAAIAGGAKSVLNMDMSSPALRVGRDNHRLNNQSLKRVRFQKLNILNSFGRIKKHGLYDLLICDPPTFQKGSIDIIRDYPKIMRKLSDFMAVESTLMLCINAPQLGQQNGSDFIIQNMQENAPQFHFIKEIKPPKVYIDKQNKGMKTLIFKRHPPTF